MIEQLLSMTLSGVYYFLVFKFCAWCWGLVFLDLEYEDEDYEVYEDGPESREFEEAMARLGRVELLIMGEPMDDEEEVLHVV